MQLFVDLLLFFRLKRLLIPKDRTFNALVKEYNQILISESSAACPR